jgi:hypothetical protein
MTEEEKYNELEDDLIRLNYYLRRISFWRRLFKRPEKIVHEMIDGLHKSRNVVSAHVEFCTVENRDKMVTILNKADEVFTNTLLKYPRLNHWNYLVNL